MTAVRALLRTLWLPVLVGLAVGVAVEVTGLSTHIASCSGLQNDDTYWRCLFGGEALGE